MFSFLLSSSLCAFNCSLENQDSFTGQYSTITLNRTGYICLLGAQYVSFNEEMTLHYLSDETNSSKATETRAVEITKAKYNNSFIIGTASTTITALSCTKSETCNFTSLKIPSPQLNDVYIATYTDENGIVLSTADRTGVLAIVAPFKAFQIETKNCEYEIRATAFEMDGSESSYAKIDKNQVIKNSGDYAAAVFESSSGSSLTSTHTIKVTITKDEVTSDDFLPSKVPSDGVFSLKDLIKSEEGSDSELVEEDDCPEKLTPKELSEKVFNSCDDFVLNHNADQFKTITTTLKKDQKYCAYGGMIIGNIGEISADIRPAIEEGNSIDLSKDDNLDQRMYNTTATKYKNPAVIKPADQLVALTCNVAECKLSILALYETIDTFLMLNRYGNINMTHITDKVYFGFYNAHSSLLNFKKTGNINIEDNKGNPFNKDTTTTNNLQLKINAIENEVNLTVTASASAKSRELLDDSAIPPIIGRIPQKGTAYTVEEIEKEYENPGSYDPKNAQIQNTAEPVQAKDDTGKRIGITVGIILAVMVVIGIVIGCVYFFYCKPKNDGAGTSDHITDNL